MNFPKKQQLILFQEGSHNHVSLFLLPGSDEARKMTVRSGRKCSALLKRSDRIGCLAKMCLESSVWNSMSCFLTWKVKATPRRRLLFQLAPSMPRTDANAFGLLPTPQTQGLKICVNGKTVFWPTPQAGDSKNHMQHARGNPCLPLAVKLWPTPRAADGDKGIRTPEGMEKERQRRKNGVDLPTAANGRLNPAWVEWLMGYPEGWTDCEDSETP